MLAMTSAEVEWHLIQALVQVDSEKVLEISTTLNAGDFSSATTRALFRGIVALVEEGAKQVDHLSLQDWAERNHEHISLDDIVQAFDVAAIPSEVDRYAKMVRRKSRRRRFRALLEAGISRIDDPTESFSECVADVQNTILDLEGEQTGAAQAVTIGEALPGVLNQMAIERDGISKLIGLTTGVPKLDSVTTGIRAGELWIIGALPGRGKSALALQVACENAAAGKTAVVFSLEMSTEQNIRRIITHVTQTNGFCIRDPKLLRATAWNELLEKATRLRDWSLIIDDSSNLTAKQLASRMCVYAKRFKPDLFVVDYLQLLQGPGRDLRERVGSVANTLRIVAKDLGIPIVALSQLSRPADINEPPTMTRLKESGDIEAHAHVVLLIYQPINKQTYQPTGEDQLIIAKQRNGPLGEIPVLFDSKNMTFRPRAVNP